MQAKMNESVLSDPKKEPGKNQPTMPNITEGNKINNMIFVKDISPSLTPFLISNWI